MSFRSKIALPEFNHAISSLNLIQSYLFGVEKTIALSLILGETKR